MITLECSGARVLERTWRFGHLGTSSTWIVYFLGTGTSRTIGVGAPSNPRASPSTAT